MARNTLSNKGPKKKSGRKIGDKELKAASGSNRTLILAFAGFTVAALIAIAIIAISSTGGGEGDAENFTPNDQGLIPVGDTAPDFSGENLNGGGGDVSLGGGEATMLVFFASWCPHCQNEAPVISELESQYEGLDVIMAGVDGQQGDTPEAVREFVEAYDIESPTVYQPELGEEYNVTGFPTIYVLNGENEVVGAHSGEAPRAVFEGWIEEALG